MSKQEKKGLVPVLRFPEFQDAREWEEERLGNCLDYQQPTAYLVSGTNYSDTYETPVLTAGKTFILGYTGEKHGVFSKGLPVIIFDDFTTATQFVDFPFKAKSSAMKILQAKKGVNIKFMYELMQMISYEVGVHERHWISKFSQMMVYLPFQEEQQKIADCLSSIDDLITAQGQKLDTLKEHKKALMQQLFPAEGETIPRMRFPEFRGKGEWRFRKLGDFIFERNQLPEGSEPLYSLTIENGIAPKTERYERSFLVKNENEAYKLVLPKDFAYNPMNLRFGAIAMHHGTEAVTVSKYYNIFYCDDSVESQFCEIYFKSPGMITHYNNVATGSLIEKRRVHFSDFLTFDIRFPSLDEQRKITKLLASIEEVITAQAQTLEALKDHKKGLMQQLFPAIDEEVG